MPSGPQRRRPSRALAFEMLQEIRPQMAYGANSVPRVVTPYDEMIPSVEEPAAQFYLDAIRIYLGLCSGTVSIEDASRAVMQLKNSPEFVKNPVDPTLLPISEVLKNRLIDNLKTLGKYNLYTLDSIKSAYGFAFLQDDVPVQDVDLGVLRHLSKNPIASLASISKALRVAPRTASRSLDRLTERNGLRFGCLVDTSAFGIQSYLLFFRLLDRAERERIESALSEFPFTKAILTTAMSEFGYASFFCPSSKECRSILQSSVRKLTGQVFKTAVLHEQRALGAATNLELYSRAGWMFPQTLVEILSGQNTSVEEYQVPFLRCQSTQKGLSKTDFVIASILRSVARESPSMLAHRLRINGYAVEAKQVSQTIQKLKSKRVVLPTLYLGGLGLNANFCFEITANPDAIARVQASMGLIPSSIYYLSPSAIIIWINVPSSSQVEYYQAFRSLEQTDGVTSVNPIMTITRPGSRSMLDLVTKWPYGPRGWSVDPDALDLTTYVS